MITPVIADHVEDAVERAESGYEALAVELDTPGGLDFAMRAIVRRLPRSRDELSRHDWLTVLEAGCALGRFVPIPGSSTHRVNATRADIDRLERKLDRLLASQL